MLVTTKAVFPSRANSHVCWPMKGLYWGVNLCKALNGTVGKLRLKEVQASRVRQLAVLCAHVCGFVYWPHTCQAQSRPRGHWRHREVEGPACACVGQGAPGRRSSLCEGSEAAALTREEVKAAPVCSLAFLPGAVGF